MKSFALIGMPLGHSLSPQIHELITERTGLSCTYRLEPMPAEAVRPFIRGLAQAGLDGINVTIPHKQEALRCVDALSPEARAIGAVNTIAVTEAGLIGQNTDYHGFGAMLRSGDVDFAGQRCVILGAGGSARAVAATLLDGGAGEVLVASREPGGVAARFPGCRPISYGELEGMGGGLLVNCTPLGMFPNVSTCPVSEAVVGRFAAVADLVYNPGQTVLLSTARRLGCRAVGGLMMLAAQAVKAREIWHGQPIGPAVERDVCERLRQALEAGNE